MADTLLAPATGSLGVNPSSPTAVGAVPLAPPATNYIFLSTSAPLVSLQITSPVLTPSTGSLAATGTTSFAVLLPSAPAAPYIAPIATVTLNFANSDYSTPWCRQVNFLFGMDLTQQAWPYAIADSRYGTATLTLPQQGILPAGFQSDVQGTTVVNSMRRYLVQRGDSWFVDHMGDVRLSIPRKILPTGISSLEAFSSSNLFNIAFYRMPYGNGITFNFAGAAYTAPYWNAVVGDFASDTNVFRWIATTGYLMGGVGTPSIANTVGIIRPTGFESIAWGYGLVSEPLTVWNARVPFEGNMLGVPDVMLRTRWITPVLGDQSRYGQSIVTHFVQEEPIPGFDASRYGTPTVTHGVRAVYPDGLNQNYFGTLLIYHKVFLYPASANTGETFGSPTVYKDTKIIAPDPARSGETWGDNVVWNFKQHIYVNPIQVGEFWMYPRVWNYKQDITQAHSAENEQAQFGVVNVENKKRYIQPFGHPTDHYGYTYVWNKAVPLYPSGWEEWNSPKQYIAGYIQILPVQGFESFKSTQWTVVYNNARVLKPPSIDEGVVSHYITLLNLNRKFKIKSDIGADVYGPDTFIAYRNRNVDVQPYTDTTYNTFPSVALAKQYIDPLGIDSYRTSTTTLEIHWTIIAPYAPLFRGAVSEPTISNRNRTLAPPGIDMSEYPRFTVVDNFIHYLQEAGWFEETYGITSIGPRTKTLFPSPIGAPYIPVTLTVRWANPGLPYLQHIVLDLAEPDGLGGLTHPGQNGIPPMDFGTPFVRSNIIWPNGIPSGMVVSNASVYLMGAIVSSIEPTMPQIGVPTFISARWITVQLGINEEVVPITARMTPWTVYDAPVWNRPVDYGYMPGQDFDRPFFGRAEVTLKNRRVYPYGIGWSYYGWGDQIGIPSVANWEQFVLPKGWRQTTYGSTEFQNFPQYITVTGISSVVYFYDPITEAYVMTEMVGTPTVGFPPYVGPQWLYPSGFSEQWGNTFLELKNRTYNGWGGDYQTRFGTAWIHPPIHLYPVGIDGFSAYKSMIDFRIRYVQPSGFEDSTMAHDEFSYGNRLTVKLDHLRFAPAGIAPPDNTGPMVAYHDRLIAPRSLFDYHLGDQKVSSVLSPTGWMDEVFGDIDRWEAGKIKTAGADTMVFGAARAQRNISVVAMGNIAVPNPRMAFRVQTYGFPPIGYAGPSVTNPYGCNNRVITTPAGPAGAMGVPHL